jgi:hypothetical protein
VALHDDILRDIMLGRVPWRFKTSDLKRIPGTGPRRYCVGSGEYAENTINTVPRNHSIRPDGTDPGDYVQKGRKPAFLWHGKGEYELVLDRQHSFEEVSLEDEEFDITEGDDEALTLGHSAIGSRSLAARVDDALVLRVAESERPDPAAIIVRYIAEKAFQTYYRRKPVGSMKYGWGERLAAYYWPVLECDWRVTCATEKRLSNQIQQAIRKLELSSADRLGAEELLTAFKATCVWGGVRLPESDPCALADEVLCVWRALSQGRIPPSDCRLNSAWTKLYAFALPDKCVIYDSRVATAVTSILDPAMGLLSSWPKWQLYSALGTISGRGGSRPRQLHEPWRNGYGAWASQMAANLLCAKVLEEVNRQSTRTDCRKLNDLGPWTLREVEAVLFMEGY